MSVELKTRLPKPFTSLILILFYAAIVLQSPYLRSGFRVTYNFLRACSWVNCTTN